MCIRDRVGRVFVNSGIKGVMSLVTAITFKFPLEEIPEELGVLDKIESEIVFESSIFDPTDLVDVEDFI